MRLFLIYMFIILACNTIATSQIKFTNDTIVGNNSESISIDFGVELTSSSTNISFDILIANPTVIYLTKVNDDLNIISSEITPKGDGLFTIFISTKNTLSSFSIECKWLSGNDSTSQIFVQEIKIGEEEFVKDSAIIMNRFFDKSGFYVRFLESRPPYPNPLNPNETVNIELYNDIATDIRFIVYDVRGYVYLDEVNNYDKGKNSYQFATKDYPAGTYYISIITNIGNTYEKIMVYK